MNISNENNNTLISGTSSNDSILNSGSNSTIQALGGNDSITNNDNIETVIYAGTGDDYIFNDHAYYPTLEGGDGNDKIVVTRGHYINIDGGAGNDTILGETYADTWSMGGYAIIQGGAGDDYINPIYSDSSSIQGGAGNDTIISEGYNTTLSGGKGDDVISLHGASIEGSVVKYDVGDGNDIIYGFDENSAIRITSGEEYSLEDSGDDVILTVGKNKITIAGGKNLSTINVVNYEITPLDISNSKNNTLITGTELSDKITNSGSNVTINSAQGDDTLTNSGKSSSLNGSAGDDTLINSGANSTIIGAEGDDDFYNTATNVLIEGGYGNDWIESGGSNVTINPGAGYDSISIDGKNIVVNYVGGSDTIKGVNETTNLKIDGDFSKSDITEDSKDVYISHNDYILTLEDVYSTTNKLNINGVTYKIGEKNIKLQNGGDEISIGRNNVSIIGGTGNDTIYMSGSNSTINGGTGENFISLSSAAKNNFVYFSGDSTVEGFKTGFGAGSDTLYSVSDYPAVDFKTSGLTFYTDEKSVTFSDINSTAQMVLTYDNGDINNYVFIADDETYNVSNGKAKYYVGATAKMNHGISFAGVGEALDVTLNTDYAADVDFWINNIHSITGGDNETKITGSEKSDTIIGGTYLNSLIGGESGDVLVGSSGTSYYYVTAESGRDTIQNFHSGYDKIFVEDSVESVTQNENNIIVDVSDKKYSFLLQNMDDTSFTVDVAGTEYKAKVANKKLTYDGETNYYNATGKTVTIKAASDIHNADIWLNQEVGANFGNTVEFIGDIKYIDGSNATGNSRLAGSSEIENIIIAGKGKTSLWGGGITNDTLIAGNNTDTFFYVRGDGSDTIKGASENDIVDLGNNTLADIRSIEVKNNSIALNFTDDGSLYLNTNSGTNFKLDGQTYFYNKTVGDWQTK